MLPSVKLDEHPKHGIIQHDHHASSILTGKHDQHMKYCTMNDKNQQGCTDNDEWPIAYNILTAYQIHNFVLLPIRKPV